MDTSQRLERPRFFPGSELAPEDLELQQQYFREKLKRHNRVLHGFGIVSGLKVMVKSGEILVEPGLALDCEGNEIILGTTESIVLRPADNWPTAFVNLRFVEECAKPAQMALETEPASDLTIYLVESFKLAVAPDNLNYGHRHLRGRWLACSQPHALTIAKLRRNSQGWRVDRRYRAPQVK